MITGVKCNVSLVGEMQNQSGPFRFIYLNKTGSLEP